MSDSTKIALWTPNSDRSNATQLIEFMNFVLESTGFDAQGEYYKLYRWSLETPAIFWELVWKFAAIKGQSGERTYDDYHQFPGCRWFPNARLNYAENLLEFGDDDHEALVELDEMEGRSVVTYGELRERVGRCAAYLRKVGIKSDDRVAGFLPNCIEAVVAMLATTSLGAIWSSCSPDFGFQGAVDRFGQIGPRLLFTADGYKYNGKLCDSLDRVRLITESISSIEQVVVIPKLSLEPDVTRIRNSILWPVALDLQYEPLTFVSRKFNDPLFILYSSGTTGVPKCIVHGVGGTLLQHAKEHMLHADIKREDRFFYFTTCGWMMWNWLISGLARGATLILYDGSPFSRDGHRLIDAIDEEGITVFGVGAKYLVALEKTGINPSDSHQLSSLQTILSTGSPLPHESFEWVYRSFKSDVHLASICGGTDIVSCFICGVPTLPVYAGQIQAPGLGMAVDIWDEFGLSTQDKKGELVCTSPFPSCPLGFWQDPDGVKFHEAYFDRWPKIWAQGDYGEWTPEGGLIIHGRSDAVLNPGGVRIGTAEIYRQVDRVQEVLESVVVGQNFQDDVRVILFVVLREGLTLNFAITDKIKREIRVNTTPRHVPAKILQVDDIPRTISGKIAELAVRNMIHGQPIKNREALANPESLHHFCDLAALRN